MLSELGKSETGDKREAPDTEYTTMRHIPIPRTISNTTTPLRFPLFFLPISPPPRHSLTPPCNPHRSHLYNSNLASAHPLSPDLDANASLQSTKQGTTIYPLLFSSRDIHAVMVQVVPSASQSTPIQEYEKLVVAGALRPDDYQTQIIRKLQALHGALVVYDPPSPPEAPSIVNIPSLFCSIYT